MASSEVNLNLNNTNIRQINSKDIKDYLNGTSSKSNQISVDDEATIVTVNGVTSAATKQYEVQYATIVFNPSDSINNNGTKKFGYSCDEVARKLPVYIHFSDQADGINGEGKEYSTFYIGKTGMLEVQPEEQKNVNGTDYEDIHGRTYEVVIEEIRIPYKYRVIEEVNDNG